MNTFTIIMKVFFLFIDWRIEPGKNIIKTGQVGDLKDEQHGK